MINKFVWDSYLNSTGKEVVDRFQSGDSTEIVKFFKTNEHDVDWVEYIAEGAKDFENIVFPQLPNLTTIADVGIFLQELMSKPMKVEWTLLDNTKEIMTYNPDRYIDELSEISTWLYLHYPILFKPYFFEDKFSLLIQIGDAFGIDLPAVPLKQYKFERLLYYAKLCETFYKFQEENKMTPAEFCAFLYDFAPKYLASSDSVKNEIPPATQIWMVGGDRRDFRFLDSAGDQDTSTWQGNVDTKIGDIIIMYCRTPRSYVHSIWRAVSNGTADPFFQYYSSIRIGNKKLVKPVTLNELKSDQYFSKHPLVRKNLQGVNGYLFNSAD